jgi:hypothetical protein
MVEGLLGVGVRAKIGRVAVGVMWIDMSASMRGGTQSCITLACACCC